MTTKTKWMQHGARAAALTLCAVAMSALPAVAQENGAPAPAPQGQMGGPGGHHDPAQMEQRQLDMMTKHLKLTPDEVTQVKAIDETQHTQMMALRQDTATPQDEKRTKMMAMRQDREAKIRAVLTPDQQPKFDEMVARQKERMEHHRGGPEGAAPAPPSL